MDKRPFHEWEERFDLINTKSIDGFSYWNYMRRDLRKSFDDVDAEVEPAFFKQIESQKAEGIMPKLKKALGFFMDDGIRKAGKSDVLFLCHPRRIEMDGKMVSIYTDPVSDRFPDSVTFQRSGLGKYPKDKIYTKNIFFGDRISIRSYIHRYFVKTFRPSEYRRVRNTIYNEMREPFLDLKENYGFDPRPGLFADRAAELYFFYEYKRPVYKKLLEKISPKVIVEVVGGSFDAKLINEIADEMGIKTVELQHGAGILETWYPDNAAPSQFPKWFFTFGDFWKKASKLPIPEDHIISTGFPYHDMEMEAYPPEKRNRGANTIIFISGSKYGVELFSIAAELKKRHPEMDVIYKLHPREFPTYREKYKDPESSGVRVIAESKTPLYSLFSESSMQVGVDSTAVYEGMSFGLKTYIWDIPKAVLTKDLTDLNYAKHFKDADDLIRLIESRDRDAVEYDINDFFKTGSLDNLEQGIKRILDT